MGRKPEKMNVNEKKRCLALSKMCVSMQRPGTSAEKLHDAALLKEARLTNDMTPPAEETASAPKELEDERNGFGAKSLVEFSLSVAVV